MQQESKWTSSSDCNYMPLQSNYPYSNSEYSHQSNTTSNSNTTVLPGISTQSSVSGLLSGSQPGTPRPDIISSPPDKISTTPDLIRRRPPLPSRPASFTTTTFHSNPYPNNVSLRRRRTESSMFSFETGPTFNQTKQLLDLWNIDQSNGYQLQLHAKMDRGFFRAEQDWTCYRRNYFQVSASFDIHGINYLVQSPEVPCLLRAENQEIYQIDFFTIGVTARVAGSDKKIELVQHTPKRDKGPQMIPEPRVVNAGGNLHIASVGTNHNIVTFERMQFKTATANNGKRRAAQQYYEIVVDLYANSATGKAFKVATTVSAPLVVRGRSPGHYADNHSRYRSMDAGQPSSTSVPPFGMVGQGASTGSTTNGPSSNNNIHNNNDHTYLPHNQPRYNLPPTHNGNGGHSDYGHPYSSYQSPYPYQVGGFAPILNTPPALNRNDDDNHREAGYLMHPYAQSTNSGSGPYNYDSTNNKSHWSNSNRDQSSPNNTEHSNRYHTGPSDSSY